MWYIKYKQVDKIKKDYELANRHYYSNLTEKVFTNTYISLFQFDLKRVIYLQLNKKKVLCFLDV